MLFSLQYGFVSKNLGVKRTKRDNWKLTDNTEQVKELFLKDEDQFVFIAFSIQFPFSY